MSVLAIVPVTPSDLAFAQRELAGRPVLEHVLAALRGAASVDEVIVLPVDDAVILPALADALSRRSAAGVVVVHDPLRPLAPPTLVDEVVAALGRSAAPAAVPVLPVTDTLKSVDRDGYVGRTLDRALYQVICTPIAVAGATLGTALAAAGAGLARASADLAVSLTSLLSDQGVAIATLPGAVECLRVTDEAHLALAEALLASRQERAPRTQRSRPR